MVFKGKKKKDPQEQKLDILKDYQDVFKTHAGQRVLQDLMHTHWIMSSTYTNDTTQMYIREGERNVVLRVLSILKVNMNELHERIKHDKEIRDSETIV